MEAGRPISCDARLISAVALLNEPPGGRLNEMVAATRPPWWLTCVAVWLLMEEAKTGNGTMVSDAVLSALPLELPPLALAMALMSTLASALALRALVPGADACAAATEVWTGEMGLPGIWVCWVPLALPAAVLKRMRSIICGYCQYLGATSITTKYWLIWLKMVETVRWPKAS